MNQKAFEKRLQLFLNEPCFLKQYLERTYLPASKAEMLKSIFPPQTQLKRFKHLENARMSGQRDLDLDDQTLKMVAIFQRQVQTNIEKNYLEIKRQNCLKKLKMDYVQEQMSQNLDELQKLIGQHQNLSTSISRQKGYVQKMIMMTQIKKALTIQNGILRNQNEMLKKQEEDIDISIKNKVKK